jgi:hypothetical protein
MNPQREIKKDKLNLIKYGEKGRLEQAIYKKGFPNNL